MEDTRGVSGASETRMGGLLRPLRGARGCLKGPRCARKRLPRARSTAAIKPLRGSCTSFRPCRVTAAADRAGSPCGPAGRLALDPLPGSATSGSRSVVAEKHRQLPEGDHVHVPGRNFAVAQTIRKHGVSILAYHDTWMTNEPADERTLRVLLDGAGESADDLHPARHRFDQPLTGSCNTRSRADCGSGRPCGRPGHRGRELAT